MGYYIWNTFLIRMFLLLIISDISWVPSPLLAFLHCCIVLVQTWQGIVSPHRCITSEPFTSVWYYRHLKKEDLIEGHEVTLCWVSKSLFSPFSVSHWELWILFTMLPSLVPSSPIYAKSVIWILEDLRGEDLDMRW